MGTVLGSWLAFVIVFSLTYGLWQLTAFLSRPKPEGPDFNTIPVPPPSPATPPPQPSRSELIDQARTRYTENLRLVESLPLADTEREAGKDRVKQRFIRELDKLL